MSRNDFAPDMSVALDRFTVPAPREGFSERIMGVTAPVSRSASRDRRGGWRLARRVIIGTVVTGMVSAAAVASGLLGAAGIRVPVLTAMLAPEPAPTPIVKKAKSITRVTAVPRPAVVATNAEDPGLVDPGSIAPPIMMRLRLGEAVARRAQRRAERRAFIRQNPELVPVIREAAQREKVFVQANPEVRDLRRLPLTERKAFLAERPELRAALQARQTERRAFRAENPQAEAVIRARIERRRAAMRPAPVDPGVVGEPDAAR